MIKTLSANLGRNVFSQPINVTSGSGEFAPPRSILIAPRLHGPGGVETHLLNLCPLLVERGAKVTVATRLAHPSTPLVRLQRELPIRFITTPFSNDLRHYRLATLTALGTWPLYLGRERFDIIYTFEMTTFLIFLSRFLKSNGMVVGNRVGVPVPVGERLAPRVVRRLNGFIVETPVQVDAVLREYRLAIPVVALPHLGHDTGNRAPRERPTDNVLRLAFLGRYDKKKGVHRLLDAWPKLQIGPAQLDFYGQGEERDAITERIRSERMTNVNVHGGWTTSSDLASILARTDLVIFPSQEEGLPLILLEAMSQGVPFVAFDVGAIRVLADSNPDVRVVPLGDAELCTAVSELSVAVRHGKVDGGRLQRYHLERFGREFLEKRWIEALLSPESFWARKLVVDSGALGTVT